MAIVKFDGIDRIQTPNELYEKLEPQRVQVRDCVEGDAAVKRKGRDYLPAPRVKQGRPYDTYKQRAVFEEYTGLTFESMIGILFSTQPSFEDDTIRNDFISLFKDYDDAYTITKNIAEDILQDGTVGLVMDIDDNENPYIAKYRASDIINWNFDNVEGKETLTRVVVREGYISKDEQHYNYREFIMEREDENSPAVYRQYYYFQNESGQWYREDIDITKLTKNMDYIPFYFLNSNYGSIGPQAPSMYGLSQSNISHYNTYADLENVSHWVGQPVPVLSGFPELAALLKKAKNEANGFWNSLKNGYKGIMGDEDSPLNLTSADVIVTENDQAKAVFLELGPDAAATLEKRLESKMEAMRILGNQMLTAPKRVAETEESLQMQRSGENSIIANIAQVLETNITSIMAEYYSFRGQNRNFDKPVITITISPLASPKDPNLATAILGLVNGAMMSRKQGIKNLQLMGLYDDLEDIDAELELIDREYSERDVINGIPRAPIPNPNPNE